MNSPCYTLSQHWDRDQAIQNDADAELEAAREADSFSFGPRRVQFNTRFYAGPTRRKTMHQAEQAAKEMPRYQCHKQVWALKIKEIRQSPADVVVEGGSWEIVPEDEAYAPITVPHDFIMKHSPQVSGYYVVYEDGYKSFSPAEAFESGYTNIDPVSIREPDGHINKTY